MMQMHDGFQTFPENKSALFGLVSYFMTPGPQLNWKSQKSNPGTSRL